MAQLRLSRGQLSLDSYSALAWCWPDCKCNFATIRNGPPLQGLSKSFSIGALRSAVHSTVLMHLLL
jgi:hypothetical protein